MKLYTINAGFFKLDGGAMFGVVPKSIWNKLNPADDNNMCTWAMRCLLVDTGKKRILVDTGMGNKQDAKFFSYYYLHGDDTLETSLAKQHLTKDNITDVFLTHLHFDHCGGAIVREGNKLVPAFKNATYWSNEQHWNWATEPNDREKASFLKENILPIKESGRLQFIEACEGVSVFEDFTIKLVYGHTDAMMLPTIQYKGKTIVYMADLLPSAAHLPIPYIMSYDMFPLKTLNEKKSFLQEAFERDYILFFEHDPYIECCRIQKTEKGIRVKETFTLEDI
jgi:glyoxylase-like metal-dependent hydrolase (beta-lactamase superfamily II)